jgi:hypothetical protein
MTPGGAGAMIQAELRARGPMGATLTLMHRTLTGYSGSSLRRTLASLRERGRVRMEPGVRRSANGPIPQVWFAVG